MKIIAMILPLIHLAIGSSGQGKDPQAYAPVRIGIAGLTHTHVHWIFQSAIENPDRFKIVGIAEQDTALAHRYLRQYNLSRTLLFSTLQEMIAHTKPEAVTAFNSIDEHVDVVRTCAPAKIHVMVEKPLAVSLEHAREIAALADKHGIEVLTNYETTWYGSHHEMFRRIQDEKPIGNLRKIVVHDGHPGPAEIGVNEEFLRWLTDPHRNGGGALMDFGCYGANLVTWLMKGERPLTVTAVTQQIKPQMYPKVDDEATIIVTYPKTVGIIQASWNWPYNRKDIEVYGETGFFKADRRALFFQHGDSSQRELNFPGLQTPRNDPFVFLSAVVRRQIDVQPLDLSSLQLNLTAMEILQAARKSAITGKTVRLTSEK